MEKARETIEVKESSGEIALNSPQSKEIHVPVKYLLKENEMDIPEEYRDAVKQAKCKMDELLFDLKQVIKQWEPSFKSFLQKIFELREYLLEFDESYLCKWGGFGWVPTENLIGVFQMRFFSPETQQDADHQIMKYFDGDSSALQDEILGIRNPNDHIYNNAIACYEQGLYYAAGAVIFTGIEREMSKCMKNDNGIHSGIRFFTESFEKIPADENSIYYPLICVIPKLFEEMYLPFESKSSKKTIANPDDLNRNLMFHGKSENLDKVDVVKLFLAWNGLTQFLESAPIYAEN